MTCWYLGPVGACRPIPAPLRGMSVKRELVGATTRSLNGTATLYRASQPRQWELSWRLLSEDEAAYLRLVGLGLVTPPLRLIDPAVRNLLPIPVASGGSYRRDTSRFAVTVSTLSWVAVTDPPFTVPVRGALSWVRTTTAAATLTLAEANDRVPLIGRTLRISAWARGTAVECAIGYDAFNAAGSAARVTGTPITLDPTQWRYVDIAYTPTTDRVSLAPLLSIANGQAVSTIQTTGWQVAFTDEEPVFSDTWTEGGGAPVVLPIEASVDYAKWRKFLPTLTLIERRV